MTEQLLLSDLDDLQDSKASISCDAQFEKELVRDASISKENGGRVEEKSSLETLYEEVPLSKKPTKEVHEISPFKQAVKGFVLNKLSKKVGTSHILSGLTEKIVKRLEDSKDHIQPGAVHTSESDLNLTSLRSKESALEGLSSSVSCELPSVVANDLPFADVLSVEDAVECLEDLSSSLNESNLNVSYRLSLRSSSISLPSSPAHRLEKRAASVSGSLDNTESTKKFEHPCNELESAELCSASTSNLEENDEDTINSSAGESKSFENNSNSPEAFPRNVYSSQLSQNCLPKDHSNKLNSAFFNFKDFCASFSFCHILLIISVIIQLIYVSSYIAFIFNGLVIAYIVYVALCIYVQKFSTCPASDLPFSDVHLELASIQTSKENYPKKGNVKILKGEFDPEMVKGHPTDLVGITIEDHSLKISSPFNKIKDSSPQKDFASYNISGASVILVPKGVKRRSIWNKKYPICIVLSESLLEKDESSSLSTSEYLVDPPSEEDFALNKGKALYIFTLTDREKETLYWILSQSSGSKAKSAIGSDQTSCDTGSKTDFSCVSFASLLESNIDDPLDLNFDSPEDNSSDPLNSRMPSLEFNAYMKSLLETFNRMNKFSNRSRSFENLSSLKEEFSKPCESFVSKDDSYLLSNVSEYPVDWLNLVVGRVFYDFLTQECWSDYVKARIQKKLDRIEMPSFIESLVVSGVYLGSTLPQIHNVSNPEFDSNGVWFNLDFSYCGSFQMTLQTKLNISKVKQIPGAEGTDALEVKSSGIPSSESSDDEGSETKYSNIKKKKFMNTIEKWISHKHFQTVAQSKFVKKYVADLSNMPLMLTVELNTLHGILTVNIPPAPTDRIWYGFRKDPVLLLNAYPRVGTREINLTAVVKMIEKKLVQEFKKALVMPNMDDLLIPIMHSPVYT